MVIADTSVWIDFFRGSDAAHCEALAARLEDQSVALCDRVLQEVLQGIVSEPEFQSVATRLLGLPCFNLGGHDLAIAAARNYRRLRRLGVTPRSATDVLIATFCIVEGHQLLHNDRDFEAFSKHLGMASATPGRS